MAIGITESMQDLIAEMENIYGETIIGSDINLIKHLFYYLKFENTEFQLEYEDRIMVTVVEDVSQLVVSLNVLGFEESNSRRAKIRFEVVNVLYVFEVRIIDIHGSIVEISIPTELQSAEMRKHRRIIVDDLFMNFIILFKSFRGGEYVSGDNINAERRFTHLFREIKKDEPSLKLINLMITEYIFKISSEYDIKFYHTETENDTIFNLLSEDNRSLFVSNCSDFNSYIEEFQHDRLKNFRVLYNTMCENSGQEYADMFFDELRMNEIKDFIVSFIISPITLFDRVIGYVKVYTTAMDKHILTTYHAEYIHEMMELASYGLTKIAIKGTSFNMLYTNTKIVDISISGLLFEIYDSNLFSYLKKHNIIKMFIPVDEKTLAINGTITRYKQVDDTYQLGVSYAASNPDDMKILENYIFDKKKNILSE